MSKASAAAQVQHSGNRLSMRDFNRLAQFVNEYSGIKMPASKHTMLEGRLRAKADGWQFFVTAKSAQAQQSSNHPWSHCVS